MRHRNFATFHAKDPVAGSAFYSRLETSSTFMMSALQSGKMFGLWIRSDVVPSVQSQPDTAEMAINLESRAEPESALEDWKTTGAHVALESTRLGFGLGFAIRDPDGRIIRVFGPASAAA